MRGVTVLVLIISMIILVGCSKSSMPYKSLSDVKLSSPTGNVVGVQKEPAKTTEEPTAAPEQPVEEQPTGAVNCKDTDYGKFTSAAGKVKGVDEFGSEYENADTCIGNTVYEYYCDGTTAKVMQEKCTRGCQNGFCI